MIVEFEAKRGFWLQFGLPPGQPDFTGMKVLEIGCGTGKRCLDIAYRGARRVLGIDPLAISIEEAAARLPDHPDVARNVEFRVATIHDLDESDFDAVVSEDTFEHVIDLPETLAAMRSRMSPRGQALLGFGPLWHAPTGDHGWIRDTLPFGDRFPLPWGHLLAPRQWAFRRIERKSGKPARDLSDWPYLTLNEKTAADFYRLFTASGLRVRVFRTNANTSWKGKMFGSLSGLPMIGKYFTLGVYSILDA
jgi:SAM-dependent methyltransferase